MGKRSSTLSPRLNDHFFAATGHHLLQSELPQIDAEYRRLREVCLPLGVEIVNLSRESRLTSLPKMTIEDFVAAGER